MTYRPGRITTTTGLRTENNTQTPGRYSKKKKRERDIELCRLDEWTTPLTEVQKRILQNFNKLKIKLKIN
jgi:hypothetical protein